MSDLLQQDEGQYRIGSKGRYSIRLASIIGYSLMIVACIIALPLVGSNMLPTPPSTLAFAIAPPPPPPPPPPVAPKTPQPPASTPKPTVPTDAPKEITPEPPTKPSPPTTDPGDPDKGVDGGVPRPTPPPPQPQPPAPPPPEPKQERLPVGGDVKEPKKIRDVAPIYPQIAQTAKVQGYVIIEAIIGTDGSVKDAKVIKSVPLLDRAALEAVRQWRYSPPMLNGKPIEVVMSVTVIFSLR